MSKYHVSLGLSALLLACVLGASAIGQPSTPSNIPGCVYLSSPGNLTDKQTAPCTMTIDRKIKVDASVSITNPTIGAAVPATAVYIAGDKAGLLAGVTLDSSSYLNVNCQAGCSGGSFTNGTNNVAASSTNGQAAAFLYLWDGSNYDMWLGNSTDGALVNLGANNDVTVTGTVSGTGTAGSAATGVLTVQGIASMTPVQVSQATASNLNATVIGAGSAGTANAGVVTVQGIASMTPVQVSQATASNLNAVVTGAVTPADDATLGTTSVRTYALTGIYDGTGVDMWREVTNGMNTTGAGVGVIGNAAQCDDTSPQAITENSFGNLRLNCTDHALTVAGTIPDDAAAGTGYPVPVGGKYNSTLPTYTDGDRTQAQFGSRGSQHVELWQSDNNNPVNAALPALDDVATSIVALTTRSFSYVFDGTTWDRAIEFVAAADSTGTGIAAIAAYGQFDDVSVATVTENRVAPVRMSSDRALLTQPVPSAAVANSLTFPSVITAFANSENETEAKATAGNLYGFSVSNNTATIAYLTFYNSAAAGTTCGTNEVLEFIIPANTSGAGNNVILPFPVPFSTAISYCITTGIGGTGSVAANSGNAAVFFK